MDGLSPTRPSRAARIAADSPRAAARHADRQANAAANRRFAHRPPRKTFLGYPIVEKRVTAIAALAVAVTVPALAEPGQWGLFGAQERQAQTQDSADLAPMPFEIAGQSFPGSAFYYVEDTPRLAFDVEELRSVDPETETLKFAEAQPAGSAARAFQSAGSALDKARALQCLSMAVYYEAASEAYNGQRAVAQVVLNRVAHPAYPASVCGVVFQGSERQTGCQFTFTCDGSLQRKPSRRAWATAQSVALAALTGNVFEPVGWATHYHTNYVNPYWAPSLDYIGDIGTHRFYRWKGRAGKADAFSITYRGGEPLAAPNPRAAPNLAETIGRDAVRTGEPDATPPAPGRAFASTGPLDNTAQTAPPAAGPNDKLPGAGTVKPEYARSGQWIRKPGE